MSAGEQRRNRSPLQAATVTDRGYELMIDPELLALLRCPETGQSVREIQPDELAALNARIPSPILAGLIREDNALVFPVVEGIPVMLLEESIRIT